MLVVALQTGTAKGSTKLTFAEEIGRFLNGSTANHKSVYNEFAWEHLGRALLKHSFSWEKI